MAVGISILLFIFLLVLKDDNSELKAENKKLKELVEKLKEKQNQVNEIETVVSERKEENTIARSEVKREKITYRNPAEVKKQKIDSLKAKNILILAAGAFLIVLAAIVFLLTTWSTTPDIIKTGVMVILIGLFLGISYVADKKFHLEQTSKTFYYIAMAYIPIVLVAISAFQLLGYYLSFKGEGCFLYLTICALLLAILYGVESFKQRRDILAICGVLMQIGTIICLYLHFFSFDAFWLFSLILVHNIIFAIFSKMKPSQFYSDIFEVFQKVVFGTILFLAVYFILQQVGMEKCTLLHLFTLILLMANYHFLHFENLYSVLLLDAIIITFVFGLMNLKVYSVSDEWERLILLASVLALYTGRYLFTKNEIYKMLAYIAYGIAGFFAVNLIIRPIIEGECVVFDLFSVMVLIINYFALRFKEKNTSFILDGLLLLMVATFLNLECFSFSDQIKAFVLAGFVTALYTIRYFIKHEETFKVIAYASSNLFLFSFIWLCDISQEWNKYVFFVTTMVILLLERKQLSSVIKNYILGSFIISFIICGLDDKVVSFLVTIVLTGAFGVFIKKNQLNKYYYYIPIVALMNGLFFAKELVIWNIKVYMILAFLMIAFLSTLSIFEKKDNMYTVASAIYIIFAIIQFSMNKYICVALVIMWAMIHAVNRKPNKPYLAIFYTSILVLHHFVVYDLKLEDITLLLLFIYIPYIFLMSRKVLGKQKELEYIFIAIVYIVALYRYPDIMNAMLFIAFLVAMVFWGFHKKIGPLFLTSLIAVVINMFKLTYDFWKSVPWWVYLVTVGGSLLAFAIHNEINENKNKERINDAFQKLKERVDL